MSRTCSVIVTALLVVGAARASPYWIEYEPADGHFPEEEGWTRHIAYGYGGAQRWFEDGALVADTRADPHIYDYYQKQFNGTLDPVPGEVLVLQWRIRVDEVSVGKWKPGVVVFSDERWAVGFVLSETEITSSFETGVSAQFAPGVWHDFELQSTDMRAYVLTIDGSPALEGSFWLSLTPSEVDWGDGVIPSVGLTHWSYVGLGVLPEPAPCWLVMASAVLLRRRGTFEGRHDHV
jgi:hypothetical protein